MVFILSRDEATEYFIDDSDRVSYLQWTVEDWVWKKVSSDFIMDRLFPSQYNPHRDKYFWWLRDSEFRSGFGNVGATIGLSGSTLFDNKAITQSCEACAGIRPAMWVRI
jgi:hypothetical protein